MVSSWLEVEFDMTTTQKAAVFPIGQAILGGLVGSIVMAMWAMTIPQFSICAIRRFAKPPLVLTGCRIGLVHRMNGLRCDLFMR